MKYMAPDPRHTSSLCRLIFPAATIAPPQEDSSRITITAYPHRFQDSTSLPIKFAVSNAPASVMPADTRVPPASPAGMDDAVPVGFRLTVISLAPFPTPYFP